MNDKEKLKVLAEAIIEYHTDVDSNTGLKYCLHCDIREKVIDDGYLNHKSNCPVLLAEQVLKDEANNEVLLIGQKVLVLSKNRKGIIISEPDSNNLYEVSLTPQWRGYYKREDLLLTPFSDALEELQSEIAKPKPSKERFCPSCGEGKVDEVKGTEPYSEDHLMCNKCDSTFNKEEDLLRVINGTEYNITKMAMERWNSESDGFNQWYELDQDEKDTGIEMIKQIIVVRTDLNMRKGKLAAQVAHASMKVFFDKMNKWDFEDEEDCNFCLNEVDCKMQDWANKSQIEALDVFPNTNPCKYYQTNIYKTFFSKEMEDWKNGSFAKIVVGCNSEEELHELKRQADEAGIVNAIILDNGATEFHGKKTYTCLSIGPDESDKIDKITGRLKLL